MTVGIFSSRTKSPTMGIDPPPRTKTVFRAPHLPHRLRRRVHKAIAGADHDRIPGVDKPDFHLHPRGLDLLNIPLQLREGFPWRHIRHQPQTYLCECSRGDYRLCSRSGKAARHAVNVQRWSTPGTFKHGKNQAPRRARSTPPPTRDSPPLGTAEPAMPPARPRSATVPCRKCPESGCVPSHPSAGR